MKIPKTLTNFLALSGSNFLVQVLRFLTLTYLARQLSVQTFGSYNYLQLVLSYALIIAEFGLKNLAIRELAQGRAGPSLVLIIFKVRMACVAVLFPFVWYFAHRGTGYPLDVLFYFLASLLIFPLLTDYILVVREELAFLSISQTIQALVFLGGCLWGVSSDEDLLLLAKAFFVSQLICNLLIFLKSKAYARSSQGKGLTLSTLSIAGAGFPFMIIALVGGFQFSLDLFLLGLSPYAYLLGPYSAATKILALGLGIINAFLASIQPRFARMSHDLKHFALKDLTLQTTRLLLLLVLPVVVTCWQVGDVLLHLFFGEKFVGGINFLKPLSLAFMFFILALPASHVLLVSHEVKRTLRLTVGNVIILAVFLISTLQWLGGEHLPWAMTAGQMVFFVSSWVSLKHKPFSGQGVEFAVFLLPNILLALFFQAPQTHSVMGLIAATVLYLTILGLFRNRIKTWFLAVFTGR